jgi:hypothetical protein
MHMEYQMTTSIVLHTQVVYHYPEKKNKNKNKKSLTNPFWTYSYLHICKPHCAIIIMHISWIF